MLIISLINENKEINPVKKEQNPMPEKLYHYTDQNGFLGIVNNNELWATRIIYLNDNLEFKLAVDIANDILNKKIKEPRNENEKNVIGMILSEMFLDGRDRVYVCSFSENGDLLSQWRGYSKGMAGYSLGFDSLNLTSIANDNDFELSRCIYDKAEQLKTISDAIDIILNKYNFLFEQLDMSVADTNIYSGRRLKTIAEEINDRLIHIFPLMKDVSFKEEMEWRLISREPKSSDSLCFRPGNSTLIPYIKFRDKNLISKCMIEAVVGHTPNSDLAIDSTREFLRSKNIEVPVKVTKIPFRSW